MKRFFRDVTVEETGRGWQVALDGRPIKTQRGAAQIVPTQALSEALAGEWSAQGEKIDPKSFVLRDMADYAIDMVHAERDATIDNLLAFAETDTLCYRADPDEPFFRRQHDAWEPLLAAFEAREGVRVERVSGVIHRPQRADTIAHLRARLAALDDFTLAAVQTMASLAASLCVALSALEPDADADALWAAASLEEDWQAELWGRDEQAEARREKHRRDFLGAHEFARLARA